MLTLREARYISLRLNGKDAKTALRAVGFTDLHKERFETPEVKAKLEQLQRELVENTLVQGLVDAKEIHEQLTDELRGRLCELYDENDELLPVKDWPDWAQMGGVEVIDEPNMVHSKDEGGSSWDQVGRKKTVRLVNRAKTRELLGRLKSVDAFVSQGANSKEIAGEVMSEIDKRIAEGRQRASEYSVKTQEQERQIGSGTTQDVVPE